MISFLAITIKKLEQKIKDIDRLLEQAEDEWGALIRYGSCGTPINMEQLDIAYSKKRLLETERSPYQFLYRELQHCRHLQEREPELVIKKIREEIILKLAEEDRFEDCIVIQKFTNGLEEEIKNYYPHRLKRNPSMNTFSE